jgi:hypothetical protein
VNLAALGSYEFNRFCGTTMVQFAPFWGENAYGPPPKGYKDPKEPQVLFLHMNLQKLRGFDAKNANVQLLQSYDPPVSPNAINGIYGNQFGPCTYLDKCVDDCKIVDRNFKEVISDFERDYYDLARQ